VSEGLNQFKKPEGGGNSALNSQDNHAWTKVAVISIILIKFFRQFL